MSDFIKAADVDIVPYLRYIFDYCLENQVIPKEWKVAVITSIYKGKWAKTTVDNYRPISLTSIVCKIWKSILSDYIRRTCDLNNNLMEGNLGLERVIAASHSWWGFSKT